LNHARATGNWLVNVSSEKSPALAEKVQHILQKSGIDSVVSESLINGRLWYRVQITGFESKESAKNYMEQFQQKQGMTGLWVAKDKG
jgi:cell division protein FtsN